GPNSKSKSNLSRPDLCPSYERALKSGGNSSACTRDRCTPFLLALDHARLAMRRRRWPSDAEHREKRVPLSSSHPALALGAVLPMPKGGAVRVHRSQHWVKLRSTQHEQMSSALAPRTDV